MTRNRLMLLPVVAAATWVVAVAGFGMASPDFGHLRHPVALLGADNEPNASWFNLSGFVLPGLLLAWQAWRWRSSSEANGWRVRIGLQLLLLSALAFAAQGVLPLDPTDLAAPASRLHATAWSLWWIAFAPAALLVANDLRRRQWSVLLLVIAIAAIVLVMASGILLPAPLGQRLGFAAWFGWWIAAAPRMGRHP